MTTSFEVIYGQFLGSITDYKLAKLDTISLETNLETWLDNAIAEYPNPRVDLNDRDMVTKCFNVSLNSTEINALAKFMIVSYMNTHLMREDYLSQSLNSKDYRIYSPANQLKALRELKDNIRNEANSLVSKNSYSIASVKKLLKAKGKNYE